MHEDIITCVYLIFALTFVHPYFGPVENMNDVDVFRTLLSTSVDRQFGRRINRLLYQIFFQNSDTEDHLYLESDIVT
jgi:hypothetical protein